MTREAMTNGRIVRWNDSGEGAPVLMLHSGGLSGRQWRRLSEQLSGSFRCVVPDLLGYGASDPWRAGEPFHFREDLDALGPLMQSIAGPVHLVGHSYGALLALQLAIADPSRVASLAVYEPVTFGVLDPETDADAWKNLTSVNLTYEPDERGVDERWLRAFVEWWNGPGAWDAQSQEVRNAFRTTGWKVYQEVVSLGADRTTLDAYAALRQPVLLMAGSRSPLAERRVVEKLASGILNAELRVFEGLGHMAPLTHATVVNDAIADHLRKLQGWSP